MSYSAKFPSPALFTASVMMIECPLILAIMSFISLLIYTQLQKQFTEKLQCDLTICKSSLETKPQHARRLRGEGLQVNMQFIETQYFFLITFSFKFFTLLNYK